MAIVNDSKTLIANALSGKGQSAGNKQERPQAEIYINVGIPMKKIIDGEEVDYVLSLPFGLALDTMNDLVVRGNNEEWKEEATARNELKAALVNLGGALDHGTGRIMDKLVVQVYRRKEDAPVETTKEFTSMILQALS